MSAITVQLIQADVIGQYEPGFEVTHDGIRAVTFRAFLARWPAKDYIRGGGEFAVTVQGASAGWDLPTLPTPCTDTITWGHTC